MATDRRGKLIIRGIPSDDVARRVVTYLCATNRNVPPEDVACRLKRLPLVVSSSIPAEVGNRVVRSLAEMGADAVFVPEEPAPPPPAPEKTASPSPSPPSFLPPAGTRPSPAAGKSARYVRPGTGRRFNRAVIVVAVCLLVLAKTTVRMVKTGQFSPMLQNYLSATIGLPPSPVQDPEHPVTFARNATPEVRDELAAIYAKFDAAYWAVNYAEISKYLAGYTGKQDQTLRFMSSFRDYAMRDMPPSACFRSTFSVTGCTISADGNRAMLALTGELTSEEFRKAKLRALMHYRGLISFTKERGAWKIECPNRAWSREDFFFPTMANLSAQLTPRR